MLDHVLYQMVDSLSVGVVDERASTSERLLNAALESFATRGYEATSLDQIASESGVRKQTLLYHFASKEALLAAVIDQTVFELAESVRTALVDRVDRRRAVVDALFRVGSHRPELLDLVREALRLGPPAADRLRAAAEPLVNGLSSEVPREKVLGAVAIILGLATEVDVAAALDVAPTIGQLRRRRQVLLDFLDDHDA